MLLIKRDSYLFGCSRDKDVALLIFDYEYERKQHLINMLKTYYDIHFVNPLSEVDLCLVKLIIHFRPDAVIRYSYDAMLLLDKYCTDISRCINKLKHFSIRTYMFVEALRNKIDYCHYKYVIRKRGEYDIYPYSWCNKAF